MNFEFEDYRPKSPPPSYAEWTPINPVRYWLILILLLPFLLGFSFSPMGLLMNVVLLDYIFYRNALRRGEW